VEWSGVEWSGVEWSGVEWSGLADFIALMRTWVSGEGGLRMLGAGRGRRAGVEKLSFKDGKCKALRRLGLEIIAY
jgi:hypothetical protein